MAVETGLRTDKCLTSAKAPLTACDAAALAKNLLFEGLSANLGRPLVN
jgi:hypothetical protein